MPAFSRRRRSNRIDAQLRGDVVKDGNERSTILRHGDLRNSRCSADLQVRNALYATVRKTSSLSGAEDVGHGERVMGAEQPLLPIQRRLRPQRIESGFLKIKFTGQA